jgi:hypothetical protein
MNVNVKIIEFQTNISDCRGCYYNVGQRWMECPAKCCMSTINNRPIIYKSINLTNKSES